MPPIVPKGMDAPVGAFANPLPQALVLTAIVIGFGLAAFLLLLILRAQRTLGTVDVVQLKDTDPDALSDNEVQP